MKFKTLKKVLPKIERAYGGRPKGSLSSSVLVSTTSNNAVKDVDAVELEDLTVLFIQATGRCFPYIHVRLKSK